MNDRPRALHLKACRFGVTVLKVFWWTTLVAVIALAAALAAVIAGLWPIGLWLGCTAVVAVVETIVFWTGIVTVYLSSVQLGLKWRVIGVLCGWIPVANLIALRRIIRSVGSRLVKATRGKFPLNFTYPLVAWFDGPNDGLVARDSFPWGERFIWLEPTGRRGISHADMIDLNRENIEGFDVREFYVQLVSELKTRGL